MVNTIDARLRSERHVPDGADFMASVTAQEWDEANFQAVDERS
jgi:hypothetical protein